MKLEAIHSQELTKLYDEIKTIMTNIMALEKFSVVSSGGLITWLISENNCFTSDIKVSYFLPAFLVFCFGLIAAGLFYRMELIGKYIKEKYEPFMQIRDNENINFGWENYLKNTLKNRGSFLFYSRIFMWVLLLTIDLWFAIYFAFKK
jgi:hypothetical protein